MFPGLKGSATTALALVLIALAAAAVPSDANWVRLDPHDSPETVVMKAARVTPSPRQLAWQDLEYVAFVHFGMNTFTGREWGNGREDPRLFNPTAFDARQWTRTARAAGMKMIIITAKHHDGFCLWPSAYTGHSVKNSPWKNGRGDVVREVAQACRAEGLKLGIYLSPWDRHEPTYGTAAYNDYYKNQLRELLANYGPVADVWLDGAGRGRKWKKMRQLYDWEGYYALIRELQPNAVISSVGPDTRWCGNEAGKNRASEWSVVPEQFDYQAEDIGGRDKLMEAAKRGEKLRWYPAFIDTSIRPGWFYHAREDSMVKPLPKLLAIYYGAVGGNGLLILNLPPDRRGLVHENDARRVMELAQVLDRTFAQNLAAGARAVASTQQTNDDGHGAGQTLDGDPDTYWSTDEGVTAAAIVYELDGPRTFNVALLREHIKSGQRVEEFYLEAWDEGNWAVITHATVIGHKRLLRFPAVTADRVRVRIVRSRLCPTLAEFGLYQSPSASPEVY
ncbi:MAG TPA: alpha-L-fucosidase [bacterium]|nr:alpha-L-fucosidase [bacterium]